MKINSLYALAAKGDKNARDKIFRIMSESFALIARHRIGRKEDREDVVQEALAAVADRFDTTEIRSNFGGWCQSVLHNKIVDYYRRTERLGEQSLPNPDLETGSVGLETRPGFRKKLLSCFRRVLAENPRRARVMNLFYQGYEVDEICSRLDVSRASVYILLSRARSRLRSCLEGDE